MADANSSDKNELIEPDQIDYGSTTEEEIPTKSLEEMYTIIGVGKAQYIYWIFLSVICLFDTAEMVVISTIIPLLRCEWGLNIVWETLINTNVYFFSALGGALFAKLPDIYGRKKMLLISLAFLFIATSSSALAQNKLQFFLVRCIVGLCMGIIFPTCIAFSTEITKSSHREVGPMSIVFFATMGSFLTAVLAYLLLNFIGWRWFILVMVSPVLVCFLVLMCYLPESPRYLVVSGRNKEALEAFHQMAQLNNTSLPEQINIVVHSVQDLGSIADIMKPDFRRETILLSIMYFGNLLIIFGTLVFVPLALYSGFCGGQGDPPLHKCVKIQQDSLLLLSIITFAAALSGFLGYAAAMTLGRNVSFKIFSTCSFVVTLFLFKCFSKLVTVGLFFSIKLLQNAHNTVSLIVVPELYPTAFRNTALGFINSWGKLGGVVGAGAVYALYYYRPILVVIMFSGSALLVMVSSWLWNLETQKVIMRDVREE
ncbi:hypothetical protein ACHWQZ_G009209 [Mnemiopsis leidyi]